MPYRDDVPDLEDWDDDESDDPSEMDMDDELYFDDLDGEEEEAELNFDASKRYKSFSARRRIEIAREDKWLKSVMADFDDFDGIEDFSDNYAEEFSY